MENLLPSIFFKCNRFNSTVQRDYFINPNSFGDDVGKWLRVELEKVGFGVEGPDQEDWGWYLIVFDPGSSLSASVNIGLGGGNEQEAFQIFVSSKIGLISFITGKSKVLLLHANKVKAAVDDILRNDSEITLTD